MKSVEFKIGNNIVGKKHPCFISFEVGGTWTSYRDAKKLIKAAAEAGAHGIKFQLYLPGETDRMIRNRDIKIDFKTSKGKREKTIFNILKKRELSKEKWQKLINYAHNLGLAFICTANFPETIDFLQKIKVDAIKIAKGDINNVLFIDYTSKKKIPIILDGRERFSDVDIAIKICEKNHNKHILIMHCPSGYPSESAGVHLNAIPAIKSKYRYPIGYADHSIKDIMNYAALSLGVNMIEKTITSNKNTNEIEHFMSLEIDELASFVKNIHELEKARGDAKILHKSRVNENVRKSLIAKEEIKPNEKIVFEKVTFQRPGNLGISVSEGFKILNKRSKCLIKKGTVFKNNMINFKD